MLLAAARPEPEARGLEIVSTGAGATALVVQRVLDEMRLPPRLAERLRRLPLTIVVVPRRTRLTEMPQFASLRGRRTFDGRLWDDVRGTGGLALDDGRIAIAIPEENIAGGDDAYPAQSIAVHEIAHALHDHIVDSDQRDAVAKAYRARRDAGGPFVDAYAGANVREYFAQGANAYFDRWAGHERRDARWLWDHDRALYTVLARLFGPPRSAVDGDA